MRRPKISRKLHIAVVAACPFPAERGTPVRIRRLCEGLAARGHAVDVVTYHLGDRVESPGVGIHRIAPVQSYTRTAPGPTFKKLLVLDRRLAETLARLLAADQRFDVIHAHHFEGLLVARAARRGRRVPIVFDSHTSLEAELPFYLPGPVRGLSRWIGRGLDRLLPKLADHTTTVTEELRKRLIAKGVLKEHEVTTINNGLELDMFDAAARSHCARPRGKTLVFAGNLASYQGVDLMLKAFARLLESHPCARLRIVTRDAFEPFDPLARELGVRAAIDLDRVDFQGVPERLADADVALNPRPDAPGLPQKTLNYLALGLPIVSFAGSSHHLSDGESALIVENGDVDAFAAAAGRLLSGPEIARRISLNAKALARATANWDQSSAKLEDVLRRAADAAGRRDASLAPQRG